MPCRSSTDTRPSWTTAHTASLSAAAAGRPSEKKANRHASWVSSAGNTTARAVSASPIDPPTASPMPRQISPAANPRVNAVPAADDTASR